MSRRNGVRATSLVVLVLALAVSGAACSKKKAEAPPETAPEPAPEQPQQPDTTSQTPSQPEAPPEAISWQDAYFDYDKYDLRSDAREALDHDSKVLRDNAGAKVLIEGHCDERGTTEYNLALGERRAAAARDYLTAAGIDAGRLDIVSFGEERPFATGHDESSWAQNRRAHLVSK